MAVAHKKITKVLSGVMYAVTVGILSSCGGGGSGDDSSSPSTLVSTSGECEFEVKDTSEPFTLPPECADELPQPADNLENRIFILGSYVDPGTGELNLYAHGLDADGTPLSVADLQQSTINVGATSYQIGDPEVDIQAVTPGEEALSVTLLTDYSDSMSDSDLNAVSGVYKTILNKLPPVYEASVINFSRTVQIPIRLDWTEAATDLNAILSAVEVDTSFEGTATALYDALGYALQQDPAIVGGASPVEGDGLIERCRPGHMLIAFTDGLENASSTYSKPQVIDLMDTSSTVTIMLGTKSAGENDLKDFTGERGAFVYDYTTGSLGDAVQSWAESLANMVRITIAPATLFASNTVTVNMPGISTTFSPPTDGLCAVS